MTSEILREARLKVDTADCLFSLRNQDLLMAIARFCIVGTWEAYKKPEIQPIRPLQEILFDLKATATPKDLEGVPASNQHGQ